MAELQKNIRRVGGELVSARQPHGRRLLLPSEVELCKTLGLCEDEYWYFVDQTAAYNGQRKEGYELIPDIRASGLEPLFINAATGGLTLFGQVAVSVALTTIGYLLTPKPKPLEAGANIRGEDAIGSKRFAPQFSFNSLQELATLGDIVPLVFTNQIKFVNTSEVRGGIRVNGQLLWSQLLSLGRLQQLKAIALFSLGKIDGRPDFEGYAIGDLLLSTYSKKKLDLFFKSSEMNQINRIEQGDKYSESEVAGMPYRYTDVFSERWPVPNLTTEQVWPVSGTRNPTTQAVFGLYSPMPNANVVKLPYELLYPQSKSSNPAKRAVVTKQKKIATFWPTRAGITGGNITGEDNTVTYRILKSNAAYDNTEETGTAPHGIEDVISMIRSIREEVDSNLSVGESYMIGDAIIACTGVENLGNEAEEGTPWRPTTILNEKEMYSGIERQYTFKVVEAGTNYGDSFKHPNLFEHENQPQWKPWSKDQPEINGRKIRTKQIMTDYSLIYGFPYTNPILQRVAIGTITNSRPCSMTEIGLKSKVFSSIRGANINGIPTKDALDDIFDDKVNFQLGQVDLFIKRFSFFKLQVRKAGTNGVFEDLTNEIESKHTGLFCIKGNSPQFQYNYIKISHPELGLTDNDQYEYRFKPYPGNNIARLLANGTGLDQKVNLLNANLSKETSDKSVQIEANFPSNTTFGQFVITFAGRSDFVLDFNEVCNTEWIQSFNTGGGASEEGLGGVIELSKMSQVLGSAPAVYGPKAPEPQPEYQYNTTADQPHNETLVSLNTDYSEDQWAWVAYEDGKEVGVTFTEPGVAATDVEIKSTEMGGGGIIIIGQDGVHSEPSKPTLSNSIYTMSSNTAHVTSNPISGDPVNYFKITKKTPSINLTVGLSVKAYP